MMLIPSENKMFLFNPCTKYEREVIRLDYSEYRGDDHLTSLGLYYDASIDEYKAVYLLRHEHNLEFGHFVAQASLKEKKWTKVEFPFSYLYVEQGPLLHGRLHWLAYRRYDPSNKGNNKGRSIVRFNPSSSAFELFPSPPSKPGVEIMGLGVIEGCLWMTRLIEGQVEVFKMEKYGVVESWKTMFLMDGFKEDEDLRYPHMFGYSSVTVIPLFKMDNGHIMFSKYHRRHGEVFAYDPETDVYTAFCKTRTWSKQIIPFVKNLASPDGYYWNWTKHGHLGIINDREYDPDHTE